jgi:tRNA(Ile)-lysidine synthase TilS/MesJ
MLTEGARVAEAQAAPYVLLFPENNVVRHVQALSGGGDSTVMALALKEREPDTEFIYICTPTGRDTRSAFDAAKCWVCAR